MAGGRLSQVLMHCLGHWRLSPGLHDLAFLPSLGRAASQLLVPRQQVAPGAPPLHPRWPSACGTTSCL